MPRKTIDLDEKAATIYDSWEWKDKGRNASEAIKIYEENKKETPSVDERIKKAIYKHEEKYHKK